MAVYFMLEFTLHVSIMDPVLSYIGCAIVEKAVGFGSVQLFFQDLSKKHTFGMCSHWGKPIDKLGLGDRGTKNTFVILSIST